jgi:hypothetical protein
MLVFSHRNISCSFFRGSKIGDALDVRQNDWLKIKNPPALGNSGGGSGNFG